MSIDYDAIIAEAEKPAVPAATPAASPAPRAYIGEGKLTDFEVAEQVADLLPTCHADNYDEWLEVGMAFHAVDSGPRGKELWRQFSLRCPHRYEEAEIEKKWASFNPNGGKTIATLIKHVKDAGLGDRIQHYRKPLVENRNHGSQIIPPDALTIRDLATFVTSHDPNTLLGNRWLCKGGGALLIGQAGLGKSSLAMQAMILWALGLEVFGIKPVRPLKVLLIQAENDKGDLAEMVQGVLKGLGLEDRIDELNERLVFITEDARTGKEFALMLRAAVEKHKSDIAIADPLLAYIGGNISDQETVSAFLRNQINPVLHETGAALVFVHHTNKPAKDPAQRNSFVGGDFAYLGTGSAELANWARAVLVVREMKEGLYELRGAKRGKRSGLPKDDSGQGYTQLLKHGEKGICWEVATDAEAEIESAISNGEVLAVLDEIGKPSPSGKGWRWADVIKAIQDATGRKKEAAKKFFREHVARHLNQSAVGIYSVKQGTKVPEGTFKVR